MDNKKILLFDDFLGEKLDTKLWEPMLNQWGGNNGGVSPKNIKIENGCLFLEAHGNDYSGSLKGIRKVNGEFIERSDGKRVGAVVKTKEKFGSASFEVNAKVLPRLGCCNTFWTFYWKDAADPVNHEIDIEVPTALEFNKNPQDKNISFQFLRMNSWITENKYSDSGNDFGESLADGKFHTFRFDWYEGEKVEFFVDNQKLRVLSSNIPTIAGEFNVGVWFPAANKDGSGWAGNAEFDIDFMVIDWVRITTL